MTNEVIYLTTEEFNKLIIEKSLDHTYYATDEPIRREKPEHKGRWFQCGDLIFVENYYYSGVK